MMSPEPKSLIELMSHFCTVPRAPFTTGRMALHDVLSLPQMLDPDTS